LISAVATRRIRCAFKFREFTPNARTTKIKPEEKKTNKMRCVLKK